MQLEIPGYSIVSTLSQGAVATVYLALGKHPRRELALKVIPLDPNQFDFQVQLLARDRVRMQRLVHPHLVRLLDSGYHAGHYFLAMEYLPGSTLCHKRFELDLLSRLRVVLEVAKGLDCIAGQGYVHGAIAPENVLIHAHNGHAVLLGLGLNQLLESGFSEALQPVVDICFQSPEQVRGEVTDTRSDLYSLGVLFWLLLTDQLPFPAKPFAHEPTGSDRQVPHLPEHLQSFQPILNRLLQVQPAARYQRVGDFIADLGALPESTVLTAVAGFELSLLPDSESPLQSISGVATESDNSAGDLKKTQSALPENLQSNTAGAKQETELVEAFFIEKDVFHSGEDINTADRILENGHTRSRENVPLILIALISVMIPLVIYVAGQGADATVPVATTATTTPTVALPVAVDKVNPAGTVALAVTAPAEPGTSETKKINYAIEPDLAQQASAMRQQLEENFALATDLVVIYRAALRGEDPAEQAFARAGLQELQQLFVDRIRAHLAAKNVEAAEAERDMALWLFESEERLPILTDALTAVK